MTNKLQTKDICNCAQAMCYRDALEAVQLLIDNNTDLHSSENFRWILNSIYNRAHIALDHPAIDADDEKLDSNKPTPKYSYKDLGKLISGRFTQAGVNPRVIMSADSELELDEVYLAGQLVLMHDGWGDSNYQRVFKDPTLWEVVQFTEEAIQATEDFHHVFLEGVYDTKKNQGGLPVYQLSMGS